MTRVAVLTPDPADPSYAGQWPGVLERLSAALVRAGIVAEPTAWTDHVEDASGLADYPLVLPVIAWGYHRDHARWMQACATWSAAGVPLANPASVLAWNSDKSYLGRLADKGVAIPPTLMSQGITQSQVNAAFDSFGSDQVIVKPTVSGGAWRTLRLSPGQALTDPPVGAAMIQPYLQTIASHGELSLLFFGRVFSHAVLKRPVDGDFRIQVQFGGLYAAVAEPPAAALALARTVLDAIEEPLLYARIDMVPDADGRWLLMEAELIEPDFYLGTAPAGGDAFAAAVQSKLAAG
ncbi:transporter [Brevundimonas sp.]|uniref:ATP-grasp domain-containing protein n=1 Tax=Brevundimonas sp. TaxID=1871086 RepID=UPI002ABB0E33|nr:transporter [Brevundimonas sp.]MDZ4362261.1 transporter [Brevundimonas sp.]